MRIVHLEYEGDPAQLAYGDDGALKAALVYRGGRWVNANWADLFFKATKAPAPRQAQATKAPAPRQAQDEFNAQEPRDKTGEWTATASPHFKQWFGRSKVVDKTGKPLVVYHGTGKSFQSFSKKKIGSSYGVDTDGFFFTNDPIDEEGQRETASSYAESGETGPNPQVMPVYLSLQNPQVIEGRKGKGALDLYENDYLRGDESRRPLAIKRAKAKGYDGIIVRDHGLKVGPRQEADQLLIAFEPTQIKSSIGNKGTFNPRSPVVRNQDRRIRPARPRLVKMRKLLVR